MNEYDAFIEELQNDSKFRDVLSQTCQKDFKRYLITVFYLINGSKFKLKPFHKKVIAALQNLADCKNTRRNILMLAYNKT